MQVLAFLQFMQLHLQLEIQLLLEPDELVLVLLDQLVNLFVEGGLVVFEQFHVLLIELDDLSYKETLS